MGVRAGTLPPVKRSVHDHASSPGDPVRHAVEEAARLLLADGAIMYLLDPTQRTLVWAGDAGISASTDRTWMRSLVVPLGVGMFGRAVEERAVRVTHDYPEDHSFVHAWMTDEVARSAGIRSMAVSPLISGHEVLGALGVYSDRPGAFGEPEASLIRALADHAAASIANERLIEQLDRSRTELALRVERDRALRGITGRIAVLREPAGVLQQVVDESRRLLGADGAHLCRLADDGAYLIPEVVAGGEAALLDRFKEWQFPVGEGMNGLAAQLGTAVWTRDYEFDERIPHEPSDKVVAEQLGLRAMAVAPLRAQRREVIGTLAISYRQPRDIDEGAIELLQALADQAAIAVANSRLYAELQRSEERYRYLLRHSPDVAFSIDAEGRFTFLSDVVERLTGVPAADSLGRRFTVLVHPDSVLELDAAWAAITQPPFADFELRFLMPDAQGRAIPAEIRAIAMVVGGVFAGVHGLIRDLREQVRLEEHLGRQAADLAAAQERGKLAQELHDSVTQALFSMTLTTRSVELLVDRDPAAARRMLTELRELEREALAEMRALIFELRPGNLEEDGLVQALRTHTAGVQGRSGLPISVECTLSDARPPLPVESALYRIAQEALHNIVKHAQATRASVRLEEDAWELRLIVEDDGVGFDPADVPTGHLGLAGMRARAAQVGGHATVTTARGGGTRVAVHVPVQRGGAPEP